MSNHRKAYLEILNRCNLNCAFCPGTSRKAGMLDAADFEFLAGRLKGWAEYLFCHLMGEPTSHPLLPEFIGIASEMGFKSIVTTNGTLLSSRGEALIAAHPHKVSISLHAFEANDRLPGNMNFEDYIASCLDFAESASGEGIITVLRLWNLDGKSDGALNEKNEAVLAELHRRFEGEWRSIRSGMALGGKVFLEWGEKFDWPGTGAYAAASGISSCEHADGFCYALRDQVGVLCDGTVVPCCLDRDGELSLGNLYDSTLEEILASPRAAAIYDGFTSHRCIEQLCRRCMRAQYYR